MAAKAFSWLSDLIGEIRTKVNQPESDPGQLSWDASEFAFACRQEQDYLWERLSALDKDFGITIDTSLSVTANSRTFTLPTNCRMLRRVVQIDTSGNEVAGGALYDAKWEELYESERACKYLPDANQLYFAMAPSATYPVKVVYGRHPVPLCHGIVQSGASTTITLQDHELNEDDALNGLVIRIYDGTGQGQEKAVTDYDGATRVATTAAWSPVPDGTSKYTSRPELPWDLKQAFIYGVAARLVEKLHGETDIVRVYFSQREKHLLHGRGGAAALKRQSPKLIRDAYDDNGFADPMDVGSWHY